VPAETLLIEIGTEELPPKSLNRLRKSLVSSLGDALKAASLSFTDIAGYATPRRLAVRVTALNDHQPVQSVERKGPAVKAAYNDEGEPTKALQGFMRSCGVEDAGQLETLETDKGSWLVYRSEQAGQALEELLPGIISQGLANLPIDRRMRWGSNRTEFVRPAHWLVCLHGNRVLPVDVLGLTASNESQGHRFMGKGAFTIDHADSYVEACRSNSVIVSFEERQSIIAGQIAALADQEGGSLEGDTALLEEVTSLVEWPVALAGRFDDKFLAVPPEVLISAMKEHQRYFHLTEPATGKLLPRFITIANLESSNPEIVIAGNERVIRPRLSDAAFFFEQDTKSALEEKLPRLKQVVFQSELGTYQDKAIRISSTAGWIADTLGADVTNAERAGLLCKADLVSDMVIEFPDLQGTMGGYYAEHHGDSDDIVKGIAQHYRPTQAGSSLPEGVIPSAVALADKLDTLVGLFGIKQPPTGSKDPFALRRQSLGVIRICIENALDLDLKTALEKAAAGYGRDFETAAVAEYIIERLVGYYAGFGISQDVIESATAHRGADLNLHQLDGIIRAIAAFRESSVAEQVIAANKRVANLIRKSDVGDIVYDIKMASDDAEQKLYDALSSLDLTDAESAEEKLSKLADLQKPVDQFFDTVLVMADEEDIRNNRLALLRDLRAQFLEVADFSLLQ
jgi:glycyl-tRNA synthetase beta chain